MQHHRIRVEENPLLLCTEALLAKKTDCKFERKKKEGKQTCSNTLCIIFLIKIVRETPKKNKVFVH